MYSLNNIYEGTILKVIPPGQNGSLTKYQYEYDVVLNLKNATQQVYRCIAMDFRYGSSIDFEDNILDTSYRVFVFFPKGVPHLGVIIGGSRTGKIKPKEVRGPRYLRHFRQVEEEITADGKYYARTLSKNEGPTASEIELTRKSLTITANKEKDNNTIVMDQDADGITIRAGDMKITIRQNYDLVIDGNAKITVKGSVNLECGDATVKAKNLKADVSNADIKASQNVKIEASKVSLAGEEGQVLTTMSQPTCYVTGAPFKGSTKVFAGG